MTHERSSISSILYPLFALAGWTVIVLSLIPLVRVRAGLRKEIVVVDLKFGESASVPPHVSIPNRNLKRRAQTLEQQLRRLGRITAKVAPPLENEGSHEKSLRDPGFA